jgi:REP element-mobilizing transposase RayT
MQAIYTRDNCNVAFQLDWSFSIFWKDPIDSADWLETLKQQTEPDGVRILQHRFPRDDLSLFLVSTKPHVAPSQLARSVKGRLQYLMRSTRPKAFQRNYSIHSIGSVRCESVERYIAGQLVHHPFADDRMNARFEQYQIHQAGIDLTRPRFSHHAQYWYNLHICFVNENRLRETDEDVLSLTRETILQTSRNAGHLLSQGAIVPDHIHLSVGCGISDAPIDVASAESLCGDVW